MMLLLMKMKIRPLMVMGLFLCVLVDGSLVTQHIVRSPISSPSPSPATVPVLSPADGLVSAVAPGKINH